MTEHPPVKLIVFPPSPWSEKARWALDVSQIQYKTIEYMPMVSNLYVRWLSKNFKFSRKFSLPIAVIGNTVLGDSFDIARYATLNKQAQALNLFPEDRLNDIQQWNEWSERLLNILRKQAMPAMKTNQKLLESNLPPMVPSALRPYLTGVSKMAVNYIDQKYPLAPGDHELTVREGFETLREALSKVGGDYLLGQFSYADITMATALQPVLPVANVYLPLDDGTRECWTNPKLVDEFSDLIAWRDRIYETRRKG